LLKEFAVDPYYNSDLKRLHSHIDWCIGYFREEGLKGKRVLDIGSRSPMTERLEKELNMKVSNTEGDLDVSFYFPFAIYDAIIYSHTIEHQFNPLFTLLELRKHLGFINKDCPVYILLPRRTKMLWVPTHYHEIDNYRFKMLMKRARFKIISKRYYKSWREWWKYFRGIRPFIRLFIDWNVCYKVELEE